MLRSRNGKLVRGRCRSTNLCDYCARLSAVEWSEMLALDALDGSAPAVWMVLGTRSTVRDPKAFYNGRREVIRAVRERWPEAQYVCLVEFTTGYGPRSGGRRRPHWNVLLKGVPAEAVDELGEIVRAVWCRYVDALPEYQWVGVVSEFGGLMRYIALHFLKESQKPPRGWKGHRVTASHAYFARPRWQVRKAAADSLRLKRELWRAQAEGFEGAEALTVAEARRLAAEGDTWELVTVTVDGNGELLRVRGLHGGDLWRPRRAVHERVVPQSNGAGAVTWRRELVPVPKGETGRLQPGELGRALGREESERLGLHAPRSHVS